MHSRSDNFEQNSSNRVVFDKKFKRDCLAIHEQNISVKCFARYYFWINFFSNFRCKRVKCLNYTWSSYDILPPPENFSISYRIIITQLIFECTHCLTPLKITPQIKKSFRKYLKGDDLIFQDPRVDNFQWNISQNKELSYVGNISTSITRDVIDMKFYWFY